MLKTLKIYAVIALFVTLAGSATIVWWDERSASQAGFDSSSDRRAAEAADISDPSAWKEKKKADFRAQVAAKEAEDRRKRDEAIEKERKDRAEKLEALRQLASTQIKDIPINSMGTAASMLSIWVDLDRSITSFLAQAPSTEEVKIANAAKAKIGAWKSATFPKLRRAFGNFSREQLWINDINVRVTGDRADQILFIHGSFVANRNIQSSMEKVQSVLVDYRFRRACFKWVDTIYAESTCYSLRPPADDK